MQKGRPVDLPLTVDLHITKFAGGAVTVKESGCVNIVFDKFNDGRWYATQRPGVNQLADASEDVADERGRGTYYWDAVDAKYVVNADTVYKTDYTGDLAATISDGTDRVFIYEVGAYLVIIDQENDEGWYIDSAASTTLVEITDADFPSPLARGGAVLNGTLYLMNTSGEIMESAIEDPTSWNASSFITAEIEPDGGVILAKHHEHIVAIGNRTIEFFYYTASTPPASTLAVRQDISYDVGAIKGDTLAYLGNRLYFAGQDKSGAVAIYMLDNFNLSRVSSETIDTYLTSAVMTDGVGLMGAGFVSGGRDFYFLTTFNIITNIVPVESLVYVSTRGWWGHWDLQLPDVDKCPIVDWMPSATTRAGEGILSNGDLITVTDDFNPVDVVKSAAVYETGVFEPGVYSATGGGGVSIPFEIITGDYDAGSPLLKKQGATWVMHMPLSADEVITVAVSDDGEDDYDAGREVSVKDPHSRLNRNGKYRRRNNKISGTLSEQIRLENLHFTVRI
jgi:hypothetical protein